LSKKNGGKKKGFEVKGKKGRACGRVIFVDRREEGGEKKKDRAVNPTAKGWGKKRVNMKKIKENSRSRICARKKGKREERAASVLRSKKCRAKTCSGRRVKGKEHWFLSPLAGGRDRKKEECFIRPAEGFYKGEAASYCLFSAKERGERKKERAALVCPQEKKKGWTPEKEAPAPDPCPLSARDQGKERKGKKPD